MKGSWAFLSAALMVLPHCKKQEQKVGTTRASNTPGAALPGDSSDASSSLSVSLFNLSTLRALKSPTRVIPSSDITQEINTITPFFNDEDGGAKPPATQLSQCLDDLTRNIKSQVTGDTVSFTAMDLDITRCMQLDSQPGVRISRATIKYKLSSRFSSSSEAAAFANLSYRDNSKLVHANYSEVLDESLTDVSFVITEGVRSYNLTQKSYDFRGNADGKGCAVSNSDGKRILKNCFAITATQSTGNQPSAAPVSSGSSDNEYAELQFQDIELPTTATAVYYKSGKISFTLNNWSGEANYSGEQTAARWSANASGQPAATGTLRPSGNLTLHQGTTLPNVLKYFSP